MEDVPLRRLVMKMKDSCVGEMWIEDVVLRLEKQRIITLSALLTLSPIHVSDIASIDAFRAKAFVDLVCEAASPKTRSVMDMVDVSTQSRSTPSRKEEIHSREAAMTGSKREGEGGYTIHARCNTYLPTGIHSLDSILNGGIRSGLVTEIVGRPGVGKTQCCLQISAIASSRGLGVIYFDTEGKFNPMRLMEIALSRNLVSVSMSAQSRELADRIILCKPQTSSELLQELDNAQSLIVEKGVGLIVIDSVAALARMEFAVVGNSSGMVARQDMLSKLATTLKLMAESFGIPILVTNQASSSGQSLKSHEQQPKSSSYHAALGNTWAHAVNIRIMMEENSTESQSRIMRIEKSPLVEEKSVAVTIQSGGVE